MSDETGQSRRLQDFVLIIAAIAVCWQVMTRGFAASLAESWPEFAIYLNGNDATALANLADAGLAGARKAAKGRKGGAGDRSAPGAEQIREWAERAVRNDPLNTRALHVLGQLALGDGDEARAAELMAAAARRSLRESRSVYWLLGRSFRREDYGDAAHYADVLLRAHPGLVPEITPALARMSEHKTGKDEVRRILSENPPWRAGFFSHLNGAISDARTPLELLVSLKESPAPPTPADLQGYLNFLVQKRFFDLAYYVWLQFLSPEQLAGVAPLFNGGFEHEPSRAPFDWTISSGAGVTIDIVARPEQEDKRALFIEFGYGRVEFRPVTQLVVLAPGAYRFRGQHKGEIVGRRGLEWRVSCAGDKPAVIGESPMAIGGVSEWTPFEFGFTVPSQGCRAQYVSLSLAARSASEQLVSGAMWYGGLEIVSEEGGVEAVQ